MTLLSLLWSFKRRINRAQFWLGLLIQLLILLPILAVLAVLDVPDLASVLSLPWIISVAAVYTKRLHDLDYSALWLLLVFVPFFGPAGLTVLCGLFSGTLGPNEYGPDPSPGKLEKKLEGYRSDHATQVQLAAADPGNPQRQRDLAVSHIRLATTCELLGKVDDALAELRTGRAIVAKLVATAPDNAQWTKDLASFDREIAALENPQFQQQKENVVADLRAG